jgi:DNA-binding CsgD family transcriptional regulator
VTGHRGDLPVVSTQPQFALDGAVEEFALSALRIMLALGVAFALLDLVISLVEGDGDGPVLVGVVSSLAWISGLAWLDPTARFLRKAWRTAVVVAVASAVFALAGTWGNPYTSEVFVLTGLATVVESRRRVVACVVIAIAGYVGGLLAEGFTLAQLVAAPRVSVVANNIGDLVLFALVMLVALDACRRVLGTALVTLNDVRSGGSATTPALGSVISRADRGPVALLPPARPVDLVDALTEKERALLRHLAAGLRAKQVAHQTATPLPTIRRQIASAKRKTGARTVEQLVGLLVEAELPDD